MATHLSSESIVEPSLAPDLAGDPFYLDECPSLPPVGIEKINSDWNILGGGISDDVYSIIFDANGNLLAGGGFNTAGGNVVNNVTLWDGTNWNPLGTGTDGTVLDMVLDNAGNLFVGGGFTTAGGIAASNVAMWDGTTWSALGTGLDDVCTELIFDNAGNLYAVGRFNTAGGVAANKIAVWDGATWTTLGTGFNGNTEALAFDALGNLYVGGRFTMAGGNAIDNLAVWDGTTWTGVGGGFNNRCYQLFIDPAGLIYASGDFTTAGGIAANRIAVWDGATWAALGTGFTNTVWTMDMDANGDLYVGGFFTNATGNPGDRISVWDGTTWTEPGGGAANSVAAITVGPTGDVYVGGDFIKFTPSGLARKIMVWCNTVLPLELSFFEADFTENGTTLSWAKSYEDGIKDFQVEHSPDGNSWASIAYVESKAIVHQNTEYTYIHADPLRGLNYYRLKQANQNGGFVYSDVIEVLASPEIAVYPNPAKDRITLSGIELENSSIYIHDGTGRLIKQETLTGPEVDISSLSAGIYFLTVQQNKESYEFKIIKE